MPFALQCLQTLIQIFLVRKSFILLVSDPRAPLTKEGHLGTPLALHTVCYPPSLSKLKVILRPGTENTSTCPQGGRGNCLSPWGSVYSVSDQDIRPPHRSTEGKPGGRAHRGPHRFVFSPARDEQGARLSPQPHHLCIQPCHPNPRAWSKATH